MTEPLPVLPRKRPRGLWKANARQPNGNSPASTTDSDELDTSTTSSSNSKRRKCSDGSGTDSEGSSLYHDSREVLHKLAQSQTPTVGRSRTTTRPSEQIARTSDYQDWEDLKDLFAKAVEQYDGQSRNIFSSNLILTLL